MHCHRPEQAIELLQRGSVTELSLDHDLGLLDGPCERTGYDVLLWIEEQAAQGYRPPPIHLHSANPVARRRMLAAMSAIERASRRRSPETDAL